VILLGRGTPADTLIVARIVRTQILAVPVRHAGQLELRSVLAPSHRTGCRRGP